MADSFLKDPDAVLDYKRDWALWFASGETIQTSSWVVPSGITKTNESVTSTSATVWLSGGTAGTDYTVVNRIITNQGRTDDRSFLIQVRDR